jgi:hypothetical protein
MLIQQTGALIEQTAKRIFQFEDPFSLPISSDYVNLGC